MMDFFNSMLPKNLFNCNGPAAEGGFTMTGAGGSGGVGAPGVVDAATVAVAAAAVASSASTRSDAALASSMMLLDENGRKRGRESEGGESSSAARRFHAVAVNTATTAAGGGVGFGGGGITPSLAMSSPRRSYNSNIASTTTANYATTTNMGGTTSSSLTTTRTTRNAASTVNTATDADDDSSSTSSSRPVKRFRGENNKVIPVLATERPAEQVWEEMKMAAVDTTTSISSDTGSPLKKLPEDVLSHCLSFLGSVEDRFSLQCTSKQFRKISNSADMLSKVQVGGDRMTGLHGIIQEHDTPESASKSLAPFAEAGNLEAIYMVGIIKSYCHQDVEEGIRLLKHSASKGYVRASYALGLALRDSQPREATQYMQAAADEDYIPALQELLPARKMKAKYGEPKADELRLHLDPLCLNRLLSRYYVQSAELRELNTSHCWNPLCGRWAFKATVNSPQAHVAAAAAAAAAAANAVANSHATANAATNNNDQNRISMGGSNSQPTANNNNNENGTTNANNATSSSSETAGAVLNNGTETGTAGTNADDSAVPADIAVAANGAVARPVVLPCRCHVRVSRMKMCSRCCRAKYCSKLCQVYDWRSGRHKMECQFL